MRSSVLAFGFALFAIAAPARGQEAEPQVVFVEAKNPVAAGLFGLLIPGAGQAYNDQWEKAAFFFGATVFSFATAEATFDDEFDRCSARDDECSYTTSNIMGAIFLVSWGLGIVDAVRSANRINDEEEARARGTPLRASVSADGRVGVSLSLPAR